MSRTKGAPAKILFVSEHGELPAQAVIWTAQRGWAPEVLSASGFDAAAACLAAMPLAIVCDDGLDDAAITRIAATWRQHNRCGVLILATVRGSEQRAITALRAGYGDYLSVHADAAAWQRCLRDRLQERPQAANASPVAASIIGSSPALLALKQQLPRIAASDCTTLIIGETGTGKERVAEQIHALSARAEAPLVAINCAALPDALLESELFGYEKGAFTGAVGAYCGKLMLAEGGTLFLDEVGDLSAQGQAKLLRALESREFYRLGARHSTRFNVRIVAATNQPLELLAERGEFRKDLYYRLDVARVDLPPLRERRDDIVMLLEHYRGELGRRLQVDARFEPAVLERLSDYEWPGNIRELKNVVEACLICATDGRIGFEQLPSNLRARLDDVAAPADEREYLLATLERLNWNKSRAAASLRWSRMTLYRKLAKYAINDPAPLVLEARAQPKPYRRDTVVTGDVTAA